jgi:hypothetical protein
VISIPWVRLRFTFSVEVPVRLPEWVGSMWRGVFGRALRRLSCMTRQENYAARPLFRGSLMGRAEREAALVVETLKRAARHDLGASGGTAELEEVHCLLFTEKEGGAMWPCRPAQDTRSGGAARCQLMALPPPALAGLTLHCVALLAELYGDGVPDWDFKLLAETAAAVKGEKNLCWLDWSRYSSRQDRAMRLSGVLGTWRLSGDLVAFFPARLCGQWFGVGKETVFASGAMRSSVTRRRIARPFFDNRMYHSARIPGDKSRGRGKNPECFRQAIDSQYESGADQ